MLASQLLGVGISRYIMELSPIADVPRAEIVARLTPVVEAFLVNSSTDEDAVDRRTGPRDPGPEAGSSRQGADDSSVQRPQRT